MSIRRPLLWGLSLVLPTAAWAQPVGGRPEPAKPPLTDETLLDMLKDMGYEPKAELSPAGVHVYGITVRQDDWTYVIEVSLSGNRRKLWLSVPLSTLPGSDRLSAAPLASLLEENWNIGPAHFRVYGPTHRLNLGMAADNNGGITTARLRSDIDYILGVIRRTQPMWDVGRWPAPAAQPPAAQPPAAPAPVPAPPVPPIAPQPSGVKA